MTRHIMGSRWKVILLLGSVLACYQIYQGLQSLKRHGHHRSRKTEATLSDAECTHLKNVILNSTRKGLKEEKFFKTVKALQGCPWIANATENKLMQEDFRKCCNAFYSVIMTQENTPMGHVIKYDAQKYTRNVTKELYNLFPKKSPFQKPIRSCAVVGNGGILNNSFCGSEIDQADFVFRLNLPPLNWMNDVGTKTDLVTANPSILIDKFGRLNWERKPFINRVKKYGSSLILLPAFSFTMNTEVSLRAFHTMKDFDMNNRVIFFNPDYLSKLSAHWKNMKFKFWQLSSGIKLVSVAAEVCEKVTLYGFWPFAKNLDGIWIPHHYYDNVPAKPGFHAMPDEFYWLLQMHAKGSLHLNLGKC